MDGLPRALEFSDGVLRIILDDFYFWQLRQAAKVCRAWRAVAQGHPTYSRTVSLKIYPPGYSTVHEPDTDSAEIAVFCHRLAVSDSLCNIVSLELSIDFRPERLSDIAWSKIFCSMQPCVERLAFLSLEVNECFLAAAGTVIALPAPRLVEFRLHVRQLSRVSQRRFLKHDLFSGHAPLLQKLCLDGWASSLPPTRPGSSESIKRAEFPMAALSQVKEVELNLDGSCTEHKVIYLKRFFVHCPQLEQLVLRGGYSGACLSSAQSWDALPPADVLKLRHLSLLGDVVPDLQTGSPDPEIDAWTCDVTAVVDGFAHAQMESLEINTLATTGPTLALVLSHFGSDPLHLSASTTSGEFMPLTLSSLARACERIFVYNFSYTDLVDVNMFRYHLAPLAAQIVHLTVHRMHVAWDFVGELFEGTRGCIGVLPAVKWLSIVLGLPEGDMRDDYYRERDRTHAGHCCFHPIVMSLELPALERVELVGPADAPLRAEDVALLMGKRLRRAARRDLTLILNRVQIRGDLSQIWGYFGQIELDPGEP